MLLCARLAIGRSTPAPRRRARPSCTSAIVPAHVRSVTIASVTSSAAARDPSSAINRRDVIEQIRRNPRFSGDIRELGQIEGDERSSGIESDLPVGVDRHQDGAGNFNFVRVTSRCPSGGSHDLDCPLRIFKRYKLIENDPIGNFSCERERLRPCHAEVDGDGGAYGREVEPSPRDSAPSHR